MKKIFAIALALVMVLSMASAFAASDCYVWGTNWPCDVDDNTPWCGKGKVEIVPLVKVNTACGWEYQVNTCAGAVRSDEVYAAVKLTVEAYPDADWWNEANLFIDYSAFTREDLDDETGLNFADYEQLGDEAGQIDMTAKKEIVYYAVFADNNRMGFTGQWIDLANTDKDYVAAVDQDGDKKLTLKDVACVIEVAEDVLTCGESWDEYEMCATLSSFYDGASEEDYNKLGDYYYDFEGANAFEDMEDVEDNGEAYTGTLAIWTLEDEEDPESIENYVEFEVVKGAIGMATWAYDGLKDNDKFYTKVMEDFGFAACGTAPCITELNIQKNFGWNDSFESCTSWSDKAAAVVDAECVVAIPKTGDASVLAWLF